MIRVALADDHPEMRVALRLLLSLSNEIEFIGEAENGQEAIDFVKRYQPDVLVMDISMPVLNGIEATKQIVNLGLSTRVILISLHSGSFIAEQAAATGARGFIVKDDVAKRLRLAIELVYKGETFFGE